MAELKDSIEVRRKKWELEMTRIIGTLHHEEAKRKGYEGNNRQDLSKSLRAAIGGCYAEVVVAKHLDVFWGGNLDHFKAEPDVAGWDVRWTYHDQGRLLLQRHDVTNAKGNVVGDLPTRPFVLVTGEGPVFQIRGWLWGNEGQQRKWWVDSGHPFDERPCFAVQQWKLYPFPGRSKEPDRPYNSRIAPWTPPT